MNFQLTIEKIYDHLYANFSSKTPSAIGYEVGKILNTGMFIEEIIGKKPAFSYDMVEENTLLSSENDSERNNKANELRKMFKRMNKKWKLYGQDEEILLDNFDLMFCCVQLNKILISDKDRDIFGDAAELFRTEWAKRMGGQFFTDQQVTKISVHLLEFDPRKGDDLVDICAGTGGFLLAGLNRIQHLLEVSNGGTANENEIVKLARESLKGQEIDKEVCSVANSTLKTRLGIHGNQIVQQGDSLDVTLFNKGKSFLSENSHLCAATNPPFGTKITIKDPRILKNYQLAKKIINGRTITTPRAPDILFLEQNIRMLVPGKGRLAIVLPYQLLSGPQTLYVRKWLLDNTKIIAVIDLPPETFQPYTGTKTSLLIIERKEKPSNDLDKEEDYNIFMSTPRWIGHDRRGNPVYKNNSAELLTDFDELLEAYDSYKSGEDPNRHHENSFIINYQTIVSDTHLRLNAKYHKPSLVAKEAIQFAINDPKWKIVKLKDLVKDIFYPGRFKRNYVDYFPEAIPFLGGSNITEFIVRKTKWLSPDDPKIDSLRIQTGWILITRSGTTGIISSVPESWNGYAMSEHVIRVVVDTNKIDPEYLLAILQSNYAQEILAKGVYGSVIDEINPEYIGNLDIPIPKSKKEYAQIVSMLKESEKSRQLGIVNYVSAINEMNQLISS